MANVEDGGAAFPISYTMTNEYGVQFPVVHSGMSQRDFFAGLALAGMLAGRPQGGYDDASTWSEAAYALADAMIAGRGEKGGDRG